MSSRVLPKENENTEKTGRGGMALIHYTLNPDHWEFRLETGADKGRDCAFEYIDENSEWHNGIIRCQVKGTKTPETYKISSGDFSYPIEKKTINYALRSRDAFILFLCDLVNEKVYYLPIQDYFIKNPEEYKRLEKDTKNMNLHIPVKNVVTRTEDAAIVLLANKAYSFTNGIVNCLVTTG